MIGLLDINSKDFLQLLYKSIMTLTVLFFTVVAQAGLISHTYLDHWINHAPVLSVYFGNSTTGDLIDRSQKHAIVLGTSWNSKTDLVPISTELQALSSSIISSAYSAGTTGISFKWLGNCNLETLKLSWWSF